MFEGIYRFDAKQSRAVRLCTEEVAALPKEVKRDLNLIHKKWGQKRFLSMRLVSWTAGDGTLVKKILLELGTLDNNNKLIDCNQIYLDIPKFAYLCEIMKSGVLRESIERTSEHLREEANKAYKIALEEAEKNGTKRANKENFRPQYDKNPVFETYGGSKDKGESRILKIYTGTYPNGKRNDKIIFEASSGDGKVCGSGAIRPAGKMKKVIVGFTDQDLGEAGMAGIRALSIMDTWNAMGVLDENAALLNPKEEKDESAESERRERARVMRTQDRSSDSRGYAASGRGRQGYSYY